METTRVVATAYGGPEVLSVVHSTIKGPKPGQVLIEVRAAGANPIDCKIYGGTYGNDPSNLPLPLGFEATGIVLDVAGTLEGPTGPIVSGDEVILYRTSGAYASALLEVPSNVLAKPSSLSFEEASGLMLAGVTAAHALHATKTSSGDTLLVHGAAGGVGLMAVQLAVADGVRVIATASESQHDLLRSLGAEPVVYGEGLLERVRDLAPGGVTAAIDLIGSEEAGDVSVALVADHRRLATIVSSGRLAQLGIQALGGGPAADPGTQIRAAARLELLDRVGAGTLRVVMAGTYPLSDVATAHRELASGHTHGKIALIP